MVADEATAVVVADGTAAEVESVVAGRDHQHGRRLVWRQPWQVGRVMEGAPTEETKPPSDGKEGGRVLDIGIAVGYTVVT